MHPTTTACGVNNFFVLFIDQNGAPTLRAPDGKLTQLSDTPFSRWYLRTRCAPLRGTPEAMQWYAKQDPLNIEPILTIKTSLKPYQTLGVTRMTISNCALWLDMGLGKTLISLAYCCLALQRGEGRVFLIICPPTVFVTWEDEIQKHLTLESNPAIVIAHGPKKKKLLETARFDTNNRPTFVLTSYETVGNITEELKKLPIHTVIFDESSRIKNLSANRTKTAHAFISQIPSVRRFCLSGTPSTRDPLGFYSQYEILGQGFSGSPDRVVFDATYSSSKLFARCCTPDGRNVHVLCDTDDDMQRWLHRNRPINAAQSYADLGYFFGRSPGPRTIRILHRYRRIMDFKNLAKLQTVSRTHAYSLKKEDVLPDLPEKTYVRRAITLTPEQTRAYATCLAENQIILSHARLRFSDRTSPHCKLHQVANGFIIGPDQKIFWFKNDPKLEELLNILDESGEQKLVVWSAYRPQIERAVTVLKKNEITVCELHGGVPIKDRQEVVREFSSPNGPRVLVGNPDVAGLGLNLTAASIEVFLSIWYKPDVRTQAEDRCILEGQKVLTPNGWQPIETIKNNTKVITETGVGIVRHVHHRQNLKKITELLIEGWYEPIAMTSDHKVLLTSGNWQTAANLKPGDQVAQPKYQGTHRTEIPFDIDCKLNNTFFGSRGIQRNGRLLSAPSTVALTDEALFVFGYYAGDGFSSVAPNKGRFISFSGNDGTKQDALNKCEKWCATYGIATARYHGSTHGIEMRAYSGEWAYWFHKHFGHTAKNKKLPEFLMSLSPAQSKILLQGLMASDGYIRRNRSEYCTISNTLASQVARLMAHVNTPPTITIGSTGQYIIGSANSGRGTAGLIREVRHRFPKRYKGKREKVYDLTVEEEHNFVVGMSIVHNCHRIGQLNAVTVIDLLATNTLEVALLRNTLKKIDLEDAILGPEDLRGRQS